MSHHPAHTGARAGLFGGLRDWKQYNFVIKRLVISLLKSMGHTEVDTSKPLDFRDWDIINAWAEELASIARAPISERLSARPEYRCMSST